jgi:hypothetical protein
MAKITLILIAMAFGGSLGWPAKDYFEETCIEKADAEKILGLPARQTESSTVSENNVVQHKCSWTATKDELKSNLYYLDEQHNDAAAAHKVFEDIVVGNINNPGHSRPDIGDEAWLHSDGTNFCFLMVRKGNRIIRLKVNRLTKQTSVDEMKRVATAWQ